MRRRTPVAVVVALAALASAPLHAADRWTPLWKNADQRGEVLLQQGDAAAAAKTYRDPRRRAYAELKAGQYQQAAQDFARFDDSDAHYNRGNALARAGDLQGAVKAYDAALQRDPNNADAQRNRELVRKQLAQQKPPPSSSSQDGKRGKDGQQAPQHGDSQGGSQQQNQHSTDGKPQAGEDQKPSGAKSNADGKPQAPSGQNAGSSPQQPPPSGMNTKNDTAKAAARPSSAPSPQPEDKAPPQHSGTASPSLAEGDAKSGQTPEESQWLSQIPDDPGGLLRRKFLIEHMLRKQQQEAQP